MDVYTTINLSLAALVFVLSPGPANLAVLATSARHGFRDGFFIAVGEVLGAVLYLVVALFSLGVLAEVLAPMLVYVKLAGASYLIYLGVRQFTTRDGGETAQARPQRSVTRQILVGFLINGTNPKLAVFYLSFLPLFIDLQFLTLGVGLQVTATVGLTLLAGITGVCVLGQQLRRLLDRTNMKRRINQITGSAMIVVGISVARS